MTDLGQAFPPVITDLLQDLALAPLRRSLRYYYGDVARAAATDELYRRFVRPGDLVFDVGAHVGDRVASFRRLGARVVAVEPQPVCALALRRIYGSDARTRVVQAACGARAGILPMRARAWSWPSGIGSRRPRLSVSCRTCPTRRTRGTSTPSARSGPSPGSSSRAA